MIPARRRALTCMKIQGIVSKQQVLDNKLSAAYSTKTCDTHITFQLVPPDDHRRNLAERAIQTWKDHLVDVLSGKDETFRLYLWCQAIPQAEHQLLLLQQYHLNPKVSAYAHVYGAQNYNAAPFVLIGMGTLIHDKPKKCHTFGGHCSKGWVIGTSFEHYRAWTLWMKTTRALHISETVFHKHKYISNPDVNPANHFLLPPALQPTFSKTMFLITFPILP